MKRMITIVAVIIMFITNTVASNIRGYKDNKDHNYKHFTFVNQTDIDIYITIPNGTNKRIKAHNADYVTHNGCKVRKHHRSKVHFYKLKNKVIHKKLENHKGKKLLNKNGKHLSKKLKCGETVYIYKKNKNEEVYYTDNKPNVKSDLNENATHHDKQAILFVHGLTNSQQNWKAFTAHATEKNWRVFRTSTSRTGSIKQRAKMLASYMSGIKKQYKIKDGSLTVVAHSMGGLDIRYLVSMHNPKKTKSNLTIAAKTIKKIYTLSTPHRGDIYANEANDALRDLTETHMKWFNHKNPYENFRVNGIKVPFLALRFRCSELPVVPKKLKFETDGIVQTSRQVYPGAPYSKKIWIATHSNSLKTVKKYSHVCKGKKAIQHQTSILDHILKDAEGKITIEAIK